MPICTCERDLAAQTSVLDPECPTHGHGAEVVDDAQSKADES